MLIHKRIPYLLTAACLSSLLGCTSSDHEVSFSREIMPILSQNCLHCHTDGAEGYIASGLSMESYDQLMKGTRFGPVIQPGQSYASTLQILVEHKADQTLNMPKDNTKLKSAQIELIGKWINQGAKNN
jgi:hypothetical protein